MLSSLGSREGAAGAELQGWLTWFLATPVGDGSKCNNGRLFRRWHFEWQPLVFQVPNWRFEFGTFSIFAYVGNDHSKWLSYFLVFLFQPPEKFKASLGHSLKFPSGALLYGVGPWSRGAHLSEMFAGQVPMSRIFGSFIPISSQPSQMNIWKKKNIFFRSFHHFHPQTWPFHQFWVGFSTAPRMPPVLALGSLEPAEHAAAHWCPTGQDAWMVVVGYVWCCLLVHIPYEY